MTSSANYLNAIVLYGVDKIVTVTDFAHATDSIQLTEIFALIDSAHAFDSVRTGIFLPPLHDRAYAEDIISVARDTP